MAKRGTSARRLVSQDRVTAETLTKRVNAYVLEDASIAHAWNRWAGLSNAADDSVERPACLYHYVTDYSKQVPVGCLMGWPMKKMPTNFREQIERQREDEINGPSSYDEAHLHFVACRYRERLAALDAYADAKRKANRDNGAKALGDSLNERDRVIWAAAKEILATPSMSVADLHAKARLLQRFAPDIFKGADMEHRIARSIFSDLERLAKHSTPTIHNAA